MRRLSFISCIFLLAAASYTESIYNYSVPKIEGSSQSLSDYQGKKILIITLPIEQTAAADTLLYCLDTLAATHSSSLAVIAAPSYEDGFTEAQRDSLTQWYRSKLGNYIVVTDGLYTRKTSGTQQHPLFAWLTDENLNTVFNVDVAGPGYKFFVNTGGQLYGVLRPQAKISGQVVNMTLNAQQ